MPKRENVILTRQSNYHVEGATVLKSPDEVLHRTFDTDELFIIGGESIYRSFLKKADRIYLTVVHTEVENGDAFFPEYDESQFFEVERNRVEKPIPHTFLIFDRKLLCF